MTIFSRFYICQYWATGWRVVNGPFVSREAAKTFAPDYVGRSNDPDLQMTPAVVSRQWLADRYPLTVQGEEKLTQDLATGRLVTPFNHAAGRALIR